MKLFQVFFQSESGEQKNLYIGCNTFGEAENISLQKYSNEKVDRVILISEKLLVKKEK